MLTIALGSGCGGAEAAPGAASARAAGTEEAVLVSAAPVTVRKVQRAVGAVGSFFGYDEVTVMAEVSGRVIRVLHDIGDVVQPGDLLLEIDPTDYELAVAETRRAIESEATRIGLAEHVPPDKDFEPDKVLALIDRVFNIDQLPAVVRAKETMDNARSRLERANKLYKQNSISEEDYTQRSTDYNVAQANLFQAKWDALAVVAGIKYRLVQLRIAQRKLALTHVCVPTPTARARIPADLKYAVVQRKVTEGEMVKDAPGSSTETFELVLDGVLKLRAAVPERFVGQIREGQAAEIRVDAYPERVFPGEVLRINPMIERASRTFEVEVYVDNARRELKAGGFAKVDLLTHVDPEAWTVPAEAVVAYAGTTKIFVVREGRAHAVPIATGVEGPGWVELVRAASPDLRRDDQVVTSGKERLAERVPVSLRGK